MFVGAMKIWNKGYMDKEAVLLTGFQRDLPDSLQKGLGLYVADRSADLCNNDIRVCLLSDSVDKILDLIRDMGDHLYRRPKVLAAAFLVQHIPVYLSGCQVGVTVQIFVNETFIMSKIKVRLRTVFRNIHFPMLIGAHGSRIHINIGIQLLRGDLQSPGLQQPSKGCRCNAFP